MTLSDIGALAAALISGISLVITIRGKKLDSLEKRFDKIDEKISGIEKKYDLMNTKIDEKFDSLNQKFESINQSIRNSESRIINEIRVLDSRVSHVEGYLMGRDCKTGTGEK